MPQEKRYAERKLLERSGCATINLIDTSVKLIFAYNEPKNSRGSKMSKKAWPYLGSMKSLRSSLSPPQRQAANSPALLCVPVCAFVRLIFLIGLLDGFRHRLAHTTLIDQIGLPRT